MSVNFKQRLNKVKAFVFDIDGVLTDGMIRFTGDRFEFAGRLCGMVVEDFENVLEQIGHVCSHRRSADD